MTLRIDPRFVVTSINLDQVITFFSKYKDVKYDKNYVTKWDIPNTVVVKKLPDMVVTKYRKMAP